MEGGLCHKSISSNNASAPRIFCAPITRRVLKRPPHRPSPPARKGPSRGADSRFPFTLSEAQFVIAREAGFASWPKLKRHIEAATRDISDVLIDAALQGDPDFLAEVLSRHPAAAQNSIHAAAAIADQDSAFALLAANPRLADQPGGRRVWRPLLYLCYGRSPADEEKLCAIARRLLDLGASPSGREPGFVSTHGTTLSEDHALLTIEAAASRRASVKLVRLLLDAGADLKQTTSALLQAVRGGNTEVLKILSRCPPKFPGKKDGRFRKRWHGAARRCFGFWRLTRSFPPGSRSSMQSPSAATASISKC